MVTTKLKFDKPEVVKRTKVETTYEYIPVLGEVLGYWRKVNVMRLGETIEVHLNHSLEEYDLLFVNGKEIEIKKEIK